INSTTRGSRLPTLFCRECLGNGCQATACKVAVSRVQQPCPLRASQATYRAGECTVMPRPDSLGYAGGVPNKWVESFQGMCLFSFQGRTPVWAFSRPCATVPTVLDL